MELFCRKTSKLWMLVLIYAQSFDPDWFHLRHTHLVSWQAGTDWGVSNGLVIPSLEEEPPSLCLNVFLSTCLFVNINLAPLLHSRSPGIKIHQLNFGLLTGKTVKHFLFLLQALTRLLTWWDPVEASLAPHHLMVPLLVRTCEKWSK